MKPLLISMLILSVGCASMNEKVFNRIKVGDPSSKVVSALGVPALFQPAAVDKNANVWVYKDKEYVCGFTIEAEAVKEIVCRTKVSIQDHISVLARVAEEN
jgi:hypothetical protein